MNNFIQSNTPVTNSNYHSILEDFDSVDGFTIEDEFVSETSHFDHPKVGDFTLLIKDKIVMVGSEEMVLQEIKNVLYDDNIDHTDISLDDIVLLKRVEVKIGVFINDN